MHANVFKLIQSAASEMRVAIGRGLDISVLHLDTAETF